MDSVKVWVLVDNDGLYRARGNGGNWSVMHRTKDLSRAKIYQSEKKALSVIEDSEKEFCVPVVLSRI